MRLSYPLAVFAVGCAHLAWAEPAPADAQMAETQHEIIRRVGISVHMDDICHVLSTAERSSLDKNFALLKKDAQEGLISSVRPSDDDLTALDKESLAVAKTTACGVEAKDEIREISAKMLAYAAKAGDAGLQQANTYWELYLKMAAINGKCHFYRDEMTDIFKHKADEEFAVVAEKVPEYVESGQSEANARGIANAIEKADGAMCDDDNVKQLVTMSAWKATDTFASTPVAAPDCRAGARCDLPSTLFKNAK